MINPQLRSFDRKRFAVLIEPAVNIRNNEDLYAAVKAHGKAVIAPINNFAVAAQPVTLTPDDFGREWEGD